MNQSALVLTDFEPKNSTNYQRIDFENFKLKDLFKASKSLPEPTTFLLICQSVDEVFKAIIDDFKMIKAAGGIVKNGKGEILMIFRLGKWDLPKGKLDPGESMRETALREVEEECGIKIDYLGQNKFTTYHLYPLKGKTVIKKTKWYEMGVNGSPKLTPQKAEDITKARWLNWDKMEKVKRNTYPLILDILYALEQDHY